MSMKMKRRKDVTINWNKKYDYKDPVRVDGPVNEEKLPSVTTILGKTRSPEKEESLARWRQKVGEKEADKVRDNAAARGTIMHRILEGYIKDENHMDMSDLGQEAGVMANNLSIMDFKQSNKYKKREWIDDYFIQTAAYAIAHNYVYGSNINSGVILISVKNGPILKYISSGKEFQGFMFEWLRRVDKYYSDRHQAPRPLVV